MPTEVAVSLLPSVWSAVPLFRIFAKCVRALKLVAGCCSVKNSSTDGP